MADMDEATVDLAAIEARKKQKKLARAAAAEPVRPGGLSFFRGENSNFSPKAEELRLPDAMRTFILHGWKPVAPFINADSRVHVAGGAFARAFAASLSGKGMSSVSVLEVPGGDAISICGKLAADLAKSRKNDTRRADVIVLVPEVAGPAGASHGECLQAVEALIALMADKLPGARLIMAVSPLSGEGIVPRATAAKATLRSVIDEILWRHPHSAAVRYFPLVEITANAMNYPFGIDGSALAGCLQNLVADAFLWTFGTLGDADLDAAHVAVVAEDDAVAQAAAMLVAGDVPTPDVVVPDRLETGYLEGLTPVEPFIGPDTTIIAFGSCFANNISKYLNNLGFNVATKKDTIAYVSTMGDGIVNSYAIRQQFEWAWLNRQPKADLWHGFKAEEFGYDERVRLRIRELFDQGDVFVITLGLSEIWYDEPTGEVFWRWVPQDRYDPTRHKFRVATHEQNRENLKAIHALIREHRPAAKIIFTVSPIPLKATFREVSCVTANAVSKSSLRGAFDEFYREARAGDPDVFYFPSYEIVLDSLHYPLSSDYRHPRLHAQWLNMKAFERHYCLTGLTDADLAREYVEARTADFRLGGPEREEALEGIRAKGAVLLSDNNAARVQAFAREKVKEDVERDRAAKAEARSAKASERIEAAGTKRDEAVAARAAAAEARQAAAEERRAEAEAARAARARPAR